MESYKRVLVKGTLDEALCTLSQAFRDISEYYTLFGHDLGKEIDTSVPLLPTRTLQHLTAISNIAGVKITVKIECEDVPDFEKEI